jgi:hypothetical protein
MRLPKWPLMRIVDPTRLWQAQGVSAHGKAKVTAQQYSAAIQLPYARSPASRSGTGFSVPKTRVGLVG